MQKSSTAHIALASLIGTAIEFYDFYIYAMAAALVIGQVFFPSGDPTAQSLNALISFGIAFMARPLGAIVFGHIGDKVGRKVTLSASLMLMGGSTLLIGLLPGYTSIGIAAPILLCVLRFGQGLGLGGEWGGAALLATEHAPEGKRAWYGMFPQFGPSVGFLLSTLTFLGLSVWLTDAQFKAWGWRIPFIASALLMVVGLYVRFKLAETPAFSKLLSQQATRAIPIGHVFKLHLKPVLQGSLAMIICYHLFYTATVFCLSYGTSSLHMPRPQFLQMLCIGVLAMALANPIFASLADCIGRRPVLLGTGCAGILMGFMLPDMLAQANVLMITAFLVICLFLMGASYAPMAAFLPEQFPVDVRYTGAGLAYQIGGILGASLAPFLMQWLLTKGGLDWVGYYMSAAAFISTVAIYTMRETRELKF